ncbi:hypothetical protein FI667_g3101, partial [Globisporangium splendens]
MVSSSQSTHVRKASRAAASGSPNASSYPYFSSPAYHLWWIGILVLHRIGAAYYIAAAFAYWYLPGTYLDSCLAFCSLGMPSKYHHTMGQVHAFMGALHCGLLVWMLTWSIRRRALVFGFAGNLRLRNVQDCVENVEKQKQTPLNALWYVPHQIYNATLGRRGLFGVENPWFDVLLVLHTATTIAIPALLVLSYAKDYDFSLKRFDSGKWSDDVWFVNVLNEFQMILVISWTDLAIRMVFSFGMISNMSGMKNLIRSCVKRTQVQTTTALTPGSRSSSMMALAATRKTTDVLPATRPHGSNLDSRTSTLAYLRKLSPAWLAFRARMTRAVNVLFFVWGVVIFGLHLHAESYPNLAQCKSQVRPWLTASPACSLVNLDCYEFAVDGQRDDIEAQWSAFEALMVVRVVIKHCSNLEIPPTLQTFRNLNGIKIYNSTLTSWGADAELTNTHTPKIMSVLLVRVNLTDGVLPLGLQASDFPATLNDFEFSVTNLVALPDDLDLKWPRFATVYLEFSQLTYVPEVIVRLTPYYLSFARSPIEELPAALFETSGISYIDIGWTKVSLLPSGVKSMSPSLVKLVVQGTEIELFWSWIDAWLAIKGSRIYAWKTPYCEYLESVLSGQVAVSTPSPFSSAINVYVAPEPGTIGDDIPVLSPLLSNYSEANWAFLEHKVTCAPRKASVYNLNAEDAYSGIHVACAMNDLSSD